MSEQSFLHGSLDGSDGADDAAFDLEWIGRSTGRAERRQVVVLAIAFARVDALDPEEIAEVLGRRSRLVDQIVTRFGGSIQRVDPDLQLAAWGVLAAQEADTRLAVAAALEVAGAAMGGVRCSVDAGIAVTCEAADGRQGIDFVGDMKGKAVAQLAFAKTGEVVISDVVCRLVAGVFDASLRECEGERLWAVSRSLDWPLPDCSRAGWKLIGREDEAALLRDGWSSALHGRSGLFVLEGEAGVGKSALIGALLRDVSRVVGASHVVHCRPETAHLRFEPVRLLVERLACRPGAFRPQGSGRDGPNGMKVGLEPHHVHSPGFETGFEIGLDERVAACRALLEQMEPEDRLIGKAIGALVSYAASCQPIAIVVEDLHWADAGTLKVLQLAGEAQGKRGGLLLVATRRNGAADPAPAKPASHRSSEQLGEGWQSITLARLSFDQIEEMIGADELGSQLSLAVRRRIAEHAGGIAENACELMRLCAETPDPDAHHRLLARPNRLNSGLTGRLDLLGELKPLVQAAAVLGRLFDTKVLAAVLGLDARVLTERAGMLVDKGILMRRRSRQMFHFRFRDALLWSQAYGSVPKTRRRLLHSKIAAVLEQERDCEPEHVAHHWKKGGDAGKAFAWWFKAAHDAVQRGASASAAAFVNEALMAKQQAPEACSAQSEAELMSLLGPQLRALRGSASNETVAAYDRALQLLSSMPTQPMDLDLDVAWGMAAIHLVRGDVREAAEASGRLIADAAQRGRDDIEMLALRVHGTARLMSGRVAEAIVAFTDSAARYDRSRHGQLHLRYVSDPGAVALAHLASAQALAGEAEGARLSRRKALALATEIGHPHTIANVLGVLALASMHLGDRGAAAALSRASQTVAKAHGHKYWEVRARLILAWERGMRDPAGGFDQIKQELDLYRSTGAGRATVFVNCLAAEVAIRAGLPQEAVDLLVSVKAKSHQQGEWLYLPEVMRHEAVALVRLGALSREEAVAQLRAAEAMARDQGALAFAERAVATRAEIEAEIGARRGVLKRAR